MGPTAALPAPQDAFPAGDVFIDVRGAERAMRVTHHPDDGVVVFSLWREDRCVGTFRLDDDDAVRLTAMLIEVLASQPPP